MWSTARTTVGRVGVAAALAALGWAGPAAATTAPSSVRDPQVLTPGASEGDGLFGHSVDIDGDLMVVGDTLDDTIAHDAGAVHIYVRSASGWAREAKVAPASLGEADYFGFSVAVFEGTIVVGALDNGGGSFGPSRGAAYVIEHVDGSWTETARLDGPEPRGDSAFGYSVDIDGDTIAVGAPREGDAPAVRDAGAAYTFVRTGAQWSMQAELALPPVADDNFGSSVALEGDTLLVGAPGVDVGARDAGAGYVFTRSGSTWSARARLTSLAPQPKTMLGGSVDLDGDTAVLGSDYPADGPRTVAVHVGSGRRWTPQTELTFGNAAFGTSVALDGDTLAVGDPNDSERSPLSGAVHVYTRTGQTWTKLAKLKSPEPSLWTNYGWSVGLDSGTLAVGQTFPADGRTYVYER